MTTLIDDWPVCASCNIDLEEEELDVGLCDRCAAAEEKADRDLDDERAMA